MLITHSSFNQVLIADVNNCASNGLCRVKAKCVILISFPGVEHPFHVNSPFINRSSYCNINQLTAPTRKHVNITIRLLHFQMKCRGELKSGPFIFNTIEVLHLLQDRIKRWLLDLLEEIASKMDHP